jgi:amino acid transporter
MTAPPHTPRKVEVALDTGMRKDVSKLGLLFTGVGAIIGSGWLFGALYASQIAGPAAIFSWVIGAVIVMFIGLVYAELGAMFPVAGGIVRFPHYAFGSFTGYSVGWLSWLAAATVTPAEVLATTQYADPYIPWLMTEVDGVPVLTGPGIAVSVALMFIYSLINIMGVKLFARFNNILVWWKLAVIALVVVMFFLLEFNPENLTDHGFAPEGFGAVLTAIPAAGIAFAYLGFRNAVEYAAETDNPQRNVPFGIIWSIIICAIIYIALQIAFITGLPTELLVNGWAELDFAESAGPLAGLALVLGAVWLAYVLRIDAVVSPADTGLIYAGVTTRLAYANARNGNAPGWLEKLNSRGIPWSAVILGFVVGCICFLPFPGWQLFIGFITAAFAVSFGPGSVVVGALRRQLPDQERPFRLPGGDIIPIIAFYGSSLLVFWNEWGINEKMFVAFLVGYVVYAIYHFTAKRALPPLDIKNGLWFPLWIVGIMVVSYFGDLDPTQPPSDAWILDGGHGPIGLGLGALILLAWSIAMYYYGVASRLSPQRAADYIRGLPADDLPEEAKA